jgi:acyl-ACP thioesterase
MTAPETDPQGPLDLGALGVQERPVEGISNGFAAAYRVRFDEAGADGRLRTSGLLRYAQDIAWRHSEDLGFDRRWYTDRGRWWVVRSVDLRVLAPIAIGETLRLSTAVIGHRRIWARRRGEFRLPDGALGALATTDWVLLDERGRVMRIPEDFGLAFPNPELAEEIIRVSPPPIPATASSLELRVRPADIDPMGHVNNAVYLDWIEEAVAVAERIAVERSAAGATTAIGDLPRRIAIEYAASAEPGDVVRASAWPEAGGWWVRVSRPADGADLIRARLEPA